MSSQSLLFHEDEARRAEVDISGRLLHAVRRVLEGEEGGGGGGESLTQCIIIIPNFFCPRSICCITPDQPTCRKAPAFCFDRILNSFFFFSYFRRPTRRRLGLKTMAYGNQQSFERRDLEKDTAQCAEQEKSERCSLSGRNVTCAAQGCHACVGRNVVICRHHVLR